MKIVQVFLFFLLAVSFSGVLADPATEEQTSVSTATEPPSLISSISTLIVEVVTRIVQYLYELFDLKLRTIKFVASLYTDDNLQLFKKYINIALRLGTWLYDLIPETTSETGSRLLGALFPEQNQPTPSIDTATSSPARDNEVELDQDTRDQLFTLEKLINSRSNSDRSGV